MAEYRTIKMAFWNDPFIEELPCHAKLLYLYLFTSPHTSNLGVLEITRKKIASEVDLSSVEVDEILAELVRAGKIVTDGYSILVLNFIKNQTATSAKMIKGLRTLMKGVESGVIRGALCNGYPEIFVEEDTPSMGIRDEKKSEIPVEERELEPEVESEPEGEGEEKLSYVKPGWVSPSKVAELWNSMMPEQGFTAVGKVTSSRQNKVRARQKSFSEARDIDFWRKIFSVVAKSGWCTGKNDRGWWATFDYVVRSDEIIDRLKAGAYDDRE